MQGSGKTLAFGLPILQRLMLMKSESQEGKQTTLKALILTPTRELALQVITGRPLLLPLPVGLLKETAAGRRQAGYPECCCVQQDESTSGLVIC